MGKTNMYKEKTDFSYDSCLSCTACMSVCPVMAASADYKGPKLVGVAHERMHFAQDDVEDSLELCTNCKNCDRTCPSGVSVSTLNMLQRSQYYKTHPHTKLQDLLAHHESMAKFVRKFPLGRRWANLGLMLGGRLHAFKHMGIAKERKLPRYAPKNFYALMKKTQPIKVPSDCQVVFFPGCVISENEPNIGMAVVKLLQDNGVEVLIDDDFVCCGSPMLQLGYLDEAYEHALKNSERVAKWRAKNVPVICACPSCSLMLKEEYTTLFDDAVFAEAASNVYDTFEYLEILLKTGKAKLTANTDRPLLYHVPCHVKSQGIGTPVVNVLQAAGAEVSVINADCCGMAGCFGYFQDKYAVSMKIGKALFDVVNQAADATIISDCNSCRTQIAHGTGRKVISPIEILTTP